MKKLSFLSPVAAGAILISSLVWCILFGSHVTASQSQNQRRDVVVISAQPKTLIVTNGTEVLYLPDGYSTYLVSASAGTPQISTDLGQALSDLLSQGFRIDHVSTSMNFYGYVGDPGVYTLVRSQ